jgi:Ser/Thr protein kinase RdoA (MazF antagonist)
MTVDFTAIAAEYGLGPVDSVSPPASGTMNETFLLRTGARTVVLRRHRRTDRARVEREHEVMGFARERGIPVPAAFRTRNGDPLIFHSGRWHSMFAFAAGQEVAAGDLSPARTRAMGRMLARIHLALRDCPFTDEERVAPPPTAVEPTLQRIEKLKTVIRARNPLSQEDRGVLAHMDGQAEAVRNLDRVAPPVITEAPQLVHGDYQHTNLFFTGDEIEAVIDWDKVEARIPSQEIVRAMSLSLRLQPPLCQAFLDGYREVRELSAADLDAAAAQHGASLLHDLWVPDQFYRLGNDRVRRFLQSTPFEPFAARWNRLWLTG